MKPEDLLTVSQVSKMIEVSEETVRRWIRNKELQAFKRGNEFVISRWDIENFLITGGVPTYNNPYSILEASLGMKDATKGALLFDNAYFEVEKQWERINKDKVSMNEALQMDRKRMKEEFELSEKWHEEMKKNKSPEKSRKFSQERQKTLYGLPKWSLYQRMFFMDIHFYFVATEGLRRAVNKLKEKINDRALVSLINKFDTMFKSFNEIRRCLEHSDERVDKPQYASDFGNFDDLGFSFGGSHYNFDIENIRKLRNELCDYLLSKTLPEV